MSDKMSPARQVLQDLVQRARELGLAAVATPLDDRNAAWAEIVERVETAPNQAQQPFRAFELVPGVLAAMSPHLTGKRDRLVVIGRAHDAGPATEIPAAVSAITDGLTEFTPEAVAKLFTALSRMHGDLLDAQALEAQSSNFTKHLSQSYDNMSLLYRLGRSMNELRHPEQFVTGAVDGLCETLGYAWTAAWFRPGTREVGDLAGRFICAVEEPGFDTEALFGDFEATIGQIHREGLLGSEVSPGIFGVESGIGPELVLQPIRIDGVYSGIMAMGSKRGEDPQASSYDTQALEAVAGYVGTLLESVHLYVEQQSTIMGMLRALTASLDAKDRYTRGHSERVALLARELALHVGMSEHEAGRIHVAGILHDIGKIGVPDHVLCKPSRLTDDEFALIKRHPVLGHEILKGIPAVVDVLPGVLYHHERWDGRGYPEGLSGENIPPMARVLALADTFDSMSSNRSYRSARVRRQVLDEIRSCAGSQFDPTLAEAFLGLDFQPFDDLIARHSRERVETQDAFIIASNNGLDAA
jgi:HD-GYP domain-containing protein (c-di-GMP phosphodiesterase class II)